MAARPNKSLPGSPPRSPSASKASGDAGVRWSTYSLPRGDAKPLNAPEFSTTDPGIRTGPVLVKERKSLDDPPAPQERSSGGPVDWSMSKLNTLPKKAEENPVNSCNTTPKKPDSCLSIPTSMHVNSHRKILQRRKAIEILDSNLKLGHKLVKNEAAADCKAGCDPPSKSTDVKGPSEQYTNLMAKETGTNATAAPESGSNESISAADDFRGEPQLDMPPIENETRADVKKDDEGSENKTSGVIRPKDDATLSIFMVSGRGSPVHNTSKPTVERVHEIIDLTANEKLHDIFDGENKQVKMLAEQIEEPRSDQLFEIGQRATTAGWFVSEGEAALLAHSDGSCSYYDITNNEEKSLYKPPAGVSKNLWGDCWLIRAPGGDGRSGRYVVAASAGYTSEPGFCSWDFDTKAITAFQAEDRRANSFQISSSRTPLAPLSNRELSSRTTPAVAARQWWYSPCGPVIISASSRQKSLSSYDIRDGGFVMKWDAGSSVTSMKYSSPLQWGSQDKLVVAEEDAIALWDVSSLHPQLLHSVSLICRRIIAMHIHNFDAEPGGGVRQRVSPSEVQGKDGVFCTKDSICVLDFRLPSGIGQRFSRTGHAAQSIYYRGDNVFLGCNSTNSFIQQYSMRKEKLIASYALTRSKSHLHHSSITQVWGGSDLVMGSDGGGLFVFDASKDVSHGFSIIDTENTSPAREIIGSDDLYLRTFDYIASRVLLVSRDRPAVWRYLL